MIGFSFHSGNFFPKTEDLSDYWNLSKDENILIFSFDGLPGDTVAEILQESPEISEKLDGFTFYQDTASGAPHTSLSLLTTILGFFPPAGLSTKEIQDRYMKNALFSELHKNGFDTSIQVLEYTPSLNKNRGKGIMTPNVNTDLEINALLSVSYSRILPSKLQAFFSKMLKRFSYQVLKGKEQTLSRLIQNDTTFSKSKLDYHFISNYNKNMNSTNKNKVAQFYHFIFSHQPHNFDRSCRYHLTDEMPQNYTTAKNQVYCALKTMTGITEVLKREGIYENSLIFFTSDHGYLTDAQKTNPFDIEGTRFDPKKLYESVWWPPSRFNPFLMLKNKNSSGEMRVSRQQVSLLDIMPTVCEQVFSK